MKSIITDVNSNTKRYFLFYFLNIKIITEDFHKWLVTFLYKRSPWLTVISGQILREGIFTNAFPIEKRIIYDFIIRNDYHQYEKIITVDFSIWKYHCWVFYLQTWSPFFFYTKISSLSTFLYERILTDVLFIQKYHQHYFRFYKKISFL